MPGVQEQLPAIPWGRLRHIFMFGDGDGGVETTSTAVDAGGKAARSGLKTLIIDLGVQGGIARALGCEKAAWNDGGAALSEALKEGTPLVPRENVRPNLDVAIGGPELGDEFLVHFHTLIAAEGPQAYLRLLTCLLPIAHEYHIVVIDTPPENPSLQRLGLCASRWLVVPVRNDGGAEEGLARIGAEFTYVRWMSHLNPHVVRLFCREP